jgi:hypothetical protein
LVEIHLELAVVLLQQLPLHHQHLRQRFVSTYPRAPVIIYSLDSHLNHVVSFV